MSNKFSKLSLEELDARTLPSAPVAPISTPADITTPVIIEPPVTPPHHNHKLHGTATGNYVGSSLIVDAGISDTLTGTAELGAKRGEFTVSGSVNGVGLIAQGEAMGQLVFTNANGSITISLTGPEQKAFSPLPTKFEYTITGGTGKYANLTGHGKLTLTTFPAPTAFGLPPQGTFSLSFN
jgi:hypothetical protein